MTQKKSTKWCSIILGSYLYYHTTYQERNNGDLGSLKRYHWMQAGQRMHSSSTATQSTMFVVGNKFWCGHNLDHFFPVNNGCFTIFTVFYCFLLRSRNLRSLLVTSFTYSFLTALAYSFSLHSFQMLKLFLVSCLAFEIVQLFGSLVTVACRCPCDVCMPSPDFIWRTSACQPAAECLQDWSG